MYLRWSLQRSPYFLKRFIYDSLCNPRVLLVQCDSGPRLLPRVHSYEVCLPECRHLHTQNRRRVGVITPLFLQAYRFADRIALIDENGVYRYRDLLTCVESLTDRIADNLGGFNDDTSGERVCILCPNNASHVVAQLAASMSGSVAVGVSPLHPAPQIEYFLADSRCRMVITTEELADKVWPVASKLGVALISLKKIDYSGTTSEQKADNTSTYNDKPLQQKEERHSKRVNRLLQLRNANKFKNEDAFIFYTSGTTGSPKVWSKLLSPISEFLPRSINMFMAVPTIYAKLIDNYDERMNKAQDSSHSRDYIKTTCSSKIRLFVSGSAALPTPIMQRWEEITGHTLLERYGMTEMGMALTNPLNGPRTTGSVGHPFPFVEVCIAKANIYTEKGYDVLAHGNCRRTTITPGCENEPGELYIKGANMFHYYWDKPEATRDSFTSDGWFKTGDTAVYENGTYRILGRTCVDIIKSGGYKISALHIERHLLAHPDIAEVAVIGVRDITWGQKVAAVVVLRQGVSSLDLKDLRAWSAEHLPPYQLPSILRIVEIIPRNSLGKINKKSLATQLFGNDVGSRW